MCSNNALGYGKIVGLTLRYHQCQNKDCAQAVWVAGNSAVYNELGVFCSESCAQEFNGKQLFQVCEFETVDDWTLSQSVVVSTGGYRWIEAMAQLAPGLLALFFNTGEHGVLYNATSWAVGMNNQLSVVPVKPQGLKEKGFLQAVLLGAAFTTPKFQMILEKVKNSRGFIPVGKMIPFNEKPIEPAFARYA